uniref:Uncharacterized protein n=1 Tax=Castor canadensis TaxID=51338 RepID=A0A8C0W3Y9_CASCN
MSQSGAPRLQDENLQALPAHRPHRILTGLLRKICTALQKRTVLSLRTIILREGKKSKTS